MDAIYPVTALQKQQGEVKKAAQAGIVRITENGKGAYVFCSEEVFERMAAASRRRRGIRSPLGRPRQSRTRRHCRRTRVPRHASSHGRGRKENARPCLS